MKPIENRNPYELFKEVKKFLKDRAWEEQECGEIYINGEMATNLYSSDGFVFHLSVGEADEEDIEAMEE